MYLLRPARLSDLTAVMELARHLDSPNLPHDEAFLRQRLARSERSFAELGPPTAEREYQLALEDEEGRVVGTSAIIAKHGTPDMPHTFLRVRIEERRAETVDVSVRHCTLQLGSSSDGPSEIGALVLLPEARRSAGSPGKLLSWGRFALVARHPSSFESAIIAEMRATLDSEGRNAFWDAFGRRFTGMSYAEADRRSAKDKDFILDLFPDTPFYASLLPEGVVEQLGQVHPEAQPALRLLEAAGMHWLGEIDPFDAGPFVGAACSELTPVRDTVTGPLAAEALEQTEAHSWIAATGENGDFRAVLSPALRAADGQVALSKEAARRLGAASGDEIALTPLPRMGPDKSQGGRHG